MVCAQTACCRVRLWTALWPLWVSGCDPRTPAGAAGDESTRSSRRVGAANPPGSSSSFICLIPFFARRQHHSQYIRPPPTHSLSLHIHLRYRHRLQLYLPLYPHNTNTLILFPYFAFIPKYTRTSKTRRDRQALPAGPVTRCSAICTLIRRRRRRRRRRRLCSTARLLKAQPPPRYPPRGRLAHFVYLTLHDLPDDAVVDRCSV